MPPVARAAIEKISRAAAEAPHSAELGCPQFWILATQATPYTKPQTLAGVLATMPAEERESLERMAALCEKVSLHPTVRAFFIDNLLVRIHSFLEMIWWTGLAP